MGDLQHFVEEFPGTINGKMVGRDHFGMPGMPDHDLLVRAASMINSWLAQCRLTNGTRSSGSAPAFSGWTQLQTEMGIGFDNDTPQAGWISAHHFPVDIGHEISQPNERLDHPNSLFTG